MAQLISDFYYQYMNEEHSEIDIRIVTTSENNFLEYSIATIDVSDVPAEVRFQDIYEAQYDEMYDIAQEVVYSMGYQLEGELE